jgi:hypothetical protein
VDLFGGGSSLTTDWEVRSSVNTGGQGQEPHGAASVRRASAIEIALIPMARLVSAFQFVEVGDEFFP